MKQFGFGYDLAIAQATALAVIRAQFHRAAKHDIPSLIKTGLPTKFPCDFQDEQTKAEYQ